MNQTLPKDPMILFSFVNMKLRDEYDSIESMCDDLEIDLEELLTTLSKAGFEYNRAANKFW